MKRNDRMIIKTWLQQTGCANIPEALSKFDKVMNEGFRKRCERTATTIAKRTEPIKLCFAPLQGSKTGPMQDRNGKAYGFTIWIDPTMAYSDGIPMAEFMTRIFGLVAHEAGHIAFTDFDTFAEVGKKVLDIQESIAKLVEPVDDSFDETTEEGKKLKESIHDKVYNYVRQTQMRNMVNSIEDASIEHMVAGRAPSVYGSLIAMRDYVVKEERELAISGKMDTRDGVSHFIADIRHLATVGYRSPELEPICLPQICDADDIATIREDCIWSCLASRNTKERIDVSETLMDFLDTPLCDLADKMTDEYIHVLKNQGKEEAMNNLSSNSGASSSDVSEGLGGMSSSTAQDSSAPYSLPIPENLQKKMEENENTSDEKSDGQSDGNGEKSEGNNASDKSDDSSNGNGQADSSNSEEKEGENQSSSFSPNKDGENIESKDEESKDGKSDSDQSESEETSDNKDGQSGTNEDSGLAGDSEEDKAGKNEEGCSQSESNYSGSDEHDAEEKHASSSSAERAKAQDAYRQSVQSMAKELEKEEGKALDDSILPKGGSGKAPMEHNLAEPTSISDAHAGIGTQFYGASQNEDVSDEGECAANGKDELKIQANSFAKKLKESLMYQAKTRRRNGLRSGKINDSDLARIVTDKRVFRKTVKGTEKKARIAVLLDLSGSMYGKKMVEAIQAAYMLTTACAKVQVPITVLGHSTTWSDDVILRQFVRFEKYRDPKEREHLFSAYAGGGNRDGLALFHTLTELVRHKRKDEQLICIVISDGAPASNDYYGEFAEADVKKIYQTFAKQYRINTIGIGIGDDIYHVPEIYKNYVLVPEVEQLGDELFKILKEVCL